MAYGIARNHPFVDGNKRTSAVACETFININDAVLCVEDIDLFPRFPALAEGKLPLEDFANWLRTHIQIAPKSRIQEPRRRYKARAGKK